MQQDYSRDDNISKSKRGNTWAVRRRGSSPVVVEGLKVLQQNQLPKSSISETRPAQCWIKTSSKVGAIGQPVVTSNHNRLPIFCSQKQKVILQVKGGNHSPGTRFVFDQLVLM